MTHQPQPDRTEPTNDHPESRRNVLRATGGLAVALALGVGRVGATNTVPESTDDAEAVPHPEMPGLEAEERSQTTLQSTSTDTGILYNEDTSLDGASITFSLTNQGSKTIITDILLLAEVDLISVKVSDQGEPTLEISVSGDGHDGTVTGSIRNGDFVSLDTDGQQASIPPGETATVTIGPYYEADIYEGGGGSVAYNEREAELEGVGFNTPMELWYHHPRSSPGAPETGSYSFEPTSL